MPTDPARLQAALDETLTAHGPGLLGLVTEDGEAVFEGAAGVADLADPRPMTADDQVKIGSITKTYVTALALLLARDGTFGLGDPLERWLPGLVPDSDGITVETLLRMRTGLPDYVWPLLGTPPDLGRLHAYRRPEELVEIALTQPDRLPVGSAYRYCNTDYVLAGLVLERATGSRVDALMWQRLFDPLGLEWTTFPIADGRLRGPHATGHNRAGDGPYGPNPSVSPSEAFTSGAMAATPRELAAFYDALLAGKVLDPADLATMTDPVEPLDEHRSRGLGLVRYELDGVVAYTHHGGVPGYTTIVARTTGGRCVVLAQNGFDLTDPLTSDAPFLTAALSGP